jgi:hypothetical protein
MGAKYAVTMKRSSHASQFTVGNFGAPGSGMRRVRCYFLQLGCEADAGDNEALWTLQRTTANGTRTSVTPQKLDPADAAAAFTAGQNHTAEPTYPANEILLDTPLNQRATYQWQAPPGGELVIPATADAGLGLKLTMFAGLAVTAVAHCEE